MGFKMNCDRCGRFIKNVSIAEVRKQVESGEVVCTPCQKWEAGAKRRVEKEINTLRSELEKYRSKFIEEITRICEETREEE